MGGGGGVGVDGWRPETATTTEPVQGRPDATTEQGEAGPPHTTADCGDNAGAKIWFVGAIAVPSVITDNACLDGGTLG